MPYLGACEHESSPSYPRMDYSTILGVKILPAIEKLNGCLTSDSTSTWRPGGWDLRNWWQWPQARPAKTEQKDELPGKKHE